MKHLFVICLAMIAISCDTTKKIDKSNVNFIEYRFSDSSVPPEYHRSYVITLTPKDAHVRVHSYGETLREESYEITEEQFSSIIDKLESSKITNSKENDDDGCTGGRGISLSYGKNDKELFSGSNYYCGGGVYGNMKGEVKELGNTIKQLIPNFTELLD